MSELPLTHADSFFAMQRERYRIKLRRDEGQPWPWSADRVFQEWRFTNVFREDDKTTKWFRENVRFPLSIQNPPDKLRIAEATVIFRAFNRISTGEIIQDLLLNGWDSNRAKTRLQDIQPLVTGAYMLKYESGVSKLDGALMMIEGARAELPRMVPKWGETLEGAWKDLKSIHYLGGFTAHEIVQDLRYTPVLENATDTMTWGHLGPGATRGMSWVVWGEEDCFSGSPAEQRLMLKLMRELLEMSKDPQYWPSIWPKWELHQVEFGLCEYSKYQKASRGIKQKRRYQR
jgi:alpha-glutamyl/putrescinyl thymine pyrophosphorylase clade 1